MLLVYVNFVFFLALNPYIRVMQLSLGEVDPAASILSFPVVGYLITTGKLPSRLRYLYVLLLIISIYSYLSILNAVEISDYLTSIGILISPLFTFIFLEYYKNIISPKILNLTTTLWFLVAVGQQFASFLIPESLIRIFISRFASTPFGGTRGVQSLSPEPSTVTYTIISFAFISLFLFKKSKISKFNLYVNLFMVGCTALLSRSLVMFGNLFFILFVYFILDNIHKFKKFNNFFKIQKTTLVISILILVSLSILGFFFPENRLFESSSFLNVDLLNKTPVEAAEKLSIEASDNRLSQFLTSYNCLKLFPLGFGVGGFSETFQASWNDLFEQYDDVRLIGRSNSYGGHIASELGFPGLLALMYFHWRFFRSSIHGSMNACRHSCVSFIVGIFWLYFHSIASIPLPWLMLILV